MKFLYFLFPFLKPDFYRYRCSVHDACTDDEETCWAEVVKCYDKGYITSSLYANKTTKNIMYDCTICDADCTFIVDNDSVLWRLKDGLVKYYDWENKEWLIPHLIKKTYKPISPP